MEKVERPAWELSYQLPGNLDFAPVYGRRTQMTAIWADSEQEAMRIAQRMGAAFVGRHTPWHSSKLPSEWWELGEHEHAMHAAVWVSMVAVKTRARSGWALLADNGVIHALAHYLLLKAQQRTLGVVGSPSDRAVMDKIADKMLWHLRELEAKTPGFQKYKEPAET